MSAKDVLEDWVLEALTELGGSGTVLEVSMVVWAKHEQDLRDAGDLFFTWQYDIRWAATKLRKRGRVAPAPSRGQHEWALQS